MIEKINPTIPIPITSSPIPDEQREIIMAKSSIAIPNPIFFIVNPPLQMSIFSILHLCFFLFQLINRPIVEITKINADIREKIPSVTTNMINVANGI